MRRCVLPVSPLRLATSRRPPLPCFQFRQTVRWRPAPRLATIAGHRLLSVLNGLVPTTRHHRRPELQTPPPRSSSVQYRLLPLSRRLITRRIVLLMAPLPSGRRQDRKTSEARGVVPRRAFSGSGSATPLNRRDFLRPTPPVPGATPGPSPSSGAFADVDKCPTRRLIELHAPTPRSRDARRGTSQVPPLPATD